MLIIVQNKLPWYSIYDGHIWSTWAHMERLDKFFSGKTTMAVTTKAEGNAMVLPSLVQRLFQTTFTVVTCK